MNTQKELPGKKVAKFWNTGLRNFLLTIGAVIVLLLIIAWLNKAEADHQVGFVAGSHEGRVNCYWTNPIYTQTGIIGHFPSEAAALDETDPGSCASWLIDHPTWQIFFSQYHYRELVILPHDSTANLSWTAPTLNEDGSVLDDLAGYNVYGGTDCATLTKATSELTVLEPATTYETVELVPGEWCFAVTAVNLTGNESVFSNTASKVIP